VTQGVRIRSAPLHKQRPGILRQIPALLVATRLLLGPVLLFSAARGATGGWFLLGIGAAFLSDVFDGIIARRLKIATERLRVADSWTDALFYACMAASAWWTRPEVVLRFRLPLLGLFCLQLFSWALDLVRYQRIATFHAYSAKAWGITLFAATLALFLPVDPAPFLWLMIAGGIISNLEGLAIKLLLPAWRHDVPSFRHALRLRRAEQAAAIPEDRSGASVSSGP
jgi:phosphatidylglycerophosphate synthase